MPTLMEILNDKICDNPELLIDALGLEGDLRGEKFTGTCSVHNGDNPHALTVYFNDYGGVRGRWICATHNCHKVHKNTLLGFVRGVLSAQYCNWSRKGDPIYGWSAMMEFLQGLYGINGSYKVDPAELARRQFVRQCGYSTEEHSRRHLCSKEEYLKCYKEPPLYMLERGFSRTVLEQYHVRYCHRPDSKFYRRILVPQIDDEDRNVLGVSARATYNSSIKWLNSENFPRNTTLYGYNYASSHIQRRRVAIIVESPGNVWRLNEAGIFHAVGIWGASGWNDYKRHLLDKLGTMKLVIAMDNDEAGRQATQHIKEDTVRFYNTVQVTVPDPYNDIADMPPSEVKNLFSAYI